MKRKVSSVNAAASDISFFSPVSVKDERRAKTKQKNNGDANCKKKVMGLQLHYRITLFATRHTAICFFYFPFPLPLFTVDDDYWFLSYNLKHKLSFFFF